MSVHPILISDPADPRLADFVRLRDVALRKSLEAEHGLFIGEGEKVIRRALAAGYPPRSFLMAERWLAPLGDALSGLRVPVFVVTDSVAEAVAGFPVHRGALASFERLPLPAVADLVAGSSSPSSSGGPPPGTAPERGTLARAPRRPGGPARPVRRLLVLEDLADHGNVGILFRCAAALGVDAVVLSPRCADPLYRRAVKVSMGAVFAIPYARMTRWYDGLAELRAAGFRLLALTPDQTATPLGRAVPGPPATEAATTEAAEYQAAGAHDVGADAAGNDAVGAYAAAEAREVGGRVALMLGSEGDGLSSRWLGEADEAVCIPMSPGALERGVDSLNVAAAGAIACHYLASLAPAPRTPSVKSNTPQPQSPWKQI